MVSSLLSKGPQSLLRVHSRSARVEITVVYLTHLASRGLDAVKQSLSLEVHIHLLGQEYAMVFGNRWSIAGLTKDHLCTVVASLIQSIASYNIYFKLYCNTVKTVLN